MYDIIFIGGGPAGYEGAISAGKKGLKTAVIERGKVGGTCLQWGCVPTKTLLHVVKAIKDMKSLAKAGLEITDYQIHLDKLIKQKDRVVSKLTRGIELLLKQNGVDTFSGSASIPEAGVVTIENQQRLTGKNIVIATGSQPADLPFLRADGTIVLNSDQALKLEKIPEKLLVIGAGAIGLELGLIYRYLGAQVTVVEIMNQIIPGSDAETADILFKELRKQKVNIHISTTISDPDIDTVNGKIKFTFKTGDKTWADTFDKALLSVGRRPNSSGFFSSSLAIGRDQRGFIQVNENLQTDQPGIFACGDVIGPPLLAHKASHQAMAIVDFIADGVAVPRQTVPSTVFTFPELASIGLSESQARSEGIEVTVGRFPYSAGSRSNAIDEKFGLVKVISDADGQLIGAHIVGADAGELLPVLTVAVSSGMKAEEFKQIIFAHPTLGENIWEAVGEIGRFSVHI